MRSTSLLSMLFVFTLLACASAQAAPITSGTGPGGVRMANGTDTLQVWLKADAISGFSDGNSISSWVDSSGYSRNTSGGVTTYETNELNNLPVIRFAGVGRLEHQLNYTYTTGTTLAIARYDLATFSNYDGIYSSNVGDAAATWMVGNLNTSSLYTAPTFYNQFYVDGIPTASIATLTKANIYSGTINTPLSRTAWNVGRDRTNAGRVWQGDISEVINYSDTLNLAERVIAENYLSAKWGVAQNTGSGALDIYAGDLNANGDYDHNVFGVGRLNASNIFNDGDGAGSGSGTGAAGFGIEASALSLGDNEWLMAGHDGAVNSIVTLEGSDPFAQEPLTGTRWDRVWYVDKTGALDATLAFDFEDSGLASPGGSDTFHLLYSADNDFSDGWQVLDTTSLQTGGTVSFSVLDGVLLDGYYTLGVNIIGVPEPSSCLLLGLGSLGLVWQARRRTQRITAER